MLFSLSSILVDKHYCLVRLLDVGIDITTRILATAQLLAQLKQLPLQRTARGCNRLPSYLCNVVRLCPPC